MSSGGHDEGRGAGAAEEVTVGIEEGKAASVHEARLGTATDGEARYQSNASGDGKSTDREYGKRSIYASSLLNSTCQCLSRCMYQSLVPESLKTPP